jgi:hypothetical protein
VIEKIWFRRTQDTNRPTIVLRHANNITTVYEITEAEYDHWVPDTNHLHGENRRVGTIWEKDLFPNLKAK